jgi:Flp pilus assembly protein TadG
MMKTLKNQQGVSGVTMMIMAFLGFLLIKAAISLVPMYFDNQMLKTALDSMDKSLELQENPRVDLLQELVVKSLKHNNLAISTEGLDIQKVDGKLILNWNYERRDTWMGSVDVVASFHLHKEYNK